MFEDVSTLEYKRDRIEKVRKHIDNAISICRKYIEDNPHEFVNSQGMSLISILNELEMIKRNLSSRENVLRYQELLKEIRNSKDYIIGKLISYTKDGKQGITVMPNGATFNVPYVPGLLPEIKSAENLYYREMNILPKWNISGETFEEYSKQLSIIIDAYNCKIIELQNKRRLF